MGKIIRNGINYGGTYDSATSVNYDNSNSGLNAHTVQEGIDEVVDSLKEKRIEFFQLAGGVTVTINTLLNAQITAYRGSNNINEVYTLCYDKIFGDGTSLNCTYSDGVLTITNPTTATIFVTVTIL